MHLLDLTAQAEDDVSELARAVGLVVPGTYATAPPEDRSALTPRVQVAQVLVGDALTLTNNNGSAAMLLGIAHDALDSLLPPVPERNRWRPSIPDALGQGRGLRRTVPVRRGVDGGNRVPGSATGSESSTIRA